MPFGFGGALKKIGKDAKVQIDKILQPNRAVGPNSNQKAMDNTTDKNKAGGPGTIIVGVGSPPIGRGKKDLKVQKVNKSGKWEDLDMKANRGRKKLRIERANKEGKWEEENYDPRRGDNSGIEVERN